MEFHDNIYNEPEEVFELNNNNANICQLESTDAQYDEPEETAQVEQYEEPEFAEPVIEDDPKVKLALVKEIRQYAMSRLKHHLIGYDLSKPTLHNMTVAELRQLKETVQFEVGTFNTSGIAHEIAAAACNAIEYTGPMLSLKLQGYAARLTTNERFLDCVEEIHLKHTSCVYVEPEYRLAIIMLGQIAYTHNLNSMETDLGDILSSQVPSTIVDKSADL